MSNISDNDIDKLFKEAAEGYQTSFDESAWEDMERRMGDNGDDGFSYFKIIGAIIGVLMLGSIVIWNSSSEKTKSNDDLNNADQIAQSTGENSADFKAGGNSFSASGNTGTSPSKTKNSIFDENASEAYSKSETAAGFTDADRKVVENQASGNASQLPGSNTIADKSSASIHQKRAYKNNLSHVGEDDVFVDTLNNIEDDVATKAQNALRKPSNNQSGSDRVIVNKQNPESNQVYNQLTSEEIRNTDASEGKEGRDDKEELQVMADAYSEDERAEQHKEVLKPVESNTLTADNDTHKPDDESDLTGISNNEEEKGYTSTNAIKNRNSQINKGNADDANVKGFVILEDDESRKISGNTPFTRVYSPMMLLDRLGYLDYQYPVGEGQLSKVEVTETSTEAARYVNNRLFALKLTYSPDLTSIGYFKPDKPGSNFGIMGSYFIGRWSISTGAIYSRKIYFTEESAGYGYYSSGSDYSRVDGDCRVIDIPINISYYLSTNINHSFYLSAGSSSYIMLKENYEYLSITNGTEKEWSQEVENENNHFFGMLNLSIGYERRVKNNVFIQLEPFVKAPIAGIGEGKVDLVSTGAFLNLVYQFNRK